MVSSTRKIKEGRIDVKNGFTTCEDFGYNLNKQLLHSDCFIVNASWSWLAATKGPLHQCSDIMVHVTNVSETKITLITMLLEPLLKFPCSLVYFTLGKSEVKGLCNPLEENGFIDKEGRRGEH
ncbi:hypothetical protein Patl1_22071 [Pistacia atlantica]|uniref:Uncharacterized protein n=1 Tax=Pistacia atlantica TaxID=434234 RepID=A0ACC1BMA8_9ROSI|nr:hypothetical protein Patl1_22071 [Pistacia atlantica]